MSPTIDLEQLDNDSRGTLRGYLFAKSSSFPSIICGVKLAYIICHRLQISRSSDTGRLSTGKANDLAKGRRAGHLCRGVGAARRGRYPIALDSIAGRRVVASYGFTFRSSLATADTAGNCIRRLPLAAAETLVAECGDRVVAGGASDGTVCAVVAWRGHSRLPTAHL